MIKVLNLKIILKVVMTTATWLGHRKHDKVVRPGLVRSKVWMEPYFYIACLAFDSHVQGHVHPIRQLNFLKDLCSKSLLDIEPWLQHEIGKRQQEINWNKLIRRRRRQWPIAQLVTACWKNKRWVASPMNTPPHLRHSISPPHPDPSSARARQRRKMLID